LSSVTFIPLSFNQSPELVIIMVLFPHSQKLMSFIPVRNPHSDNFTDETLVLKF